MPYASSIYSTETHQPAGGGALEHHLPQPTGRGSIHYVLPLTHAQRASEYHRGVVGTVGCEQ